MGLVNVVRSAPRKLITAIYPQLIPIDGPLSVMGSIFGNVVMANSTLNSDLFCNENTNGFPATSTIMTSVLSTVHGGSERVVSLG